jgi:hypothetical protein
MSLSLRAGADAIPLKMLGSIATELNPLAKPRPKRADPYYASAEWWAIRLAAFERDGYRCAAPGCHARATVVDHVTGRKRGGGADVLGNLRCLCASPTTVRLKRMRSADVATMEGSKRVERRQFFQRG